MPNSILEALAADRAAVLTDTHTMDFELPTDVAAQVASTDHPGIRRAVERFLAQPPAPGRARGVVSSMSWDVVAAKLDEVYRQVLADARRPAVPETPLAAALP